MPVDVDVLEQIRERLRVSTRVDDERIEVAGRDDDVVLLGAVASPEEATVAGQLAGEYAASVVNELQIDRGLREGAAAPPDTEPAAPAEDEVLVGSTDMLAGPGSAPTEDLAEALDENEPWTPPDVPQLAPTVTEQRGGVPPKTAWPWRSGTRPAASPAATPRPSRPPSRTTRTARCPRAAQGRRRCGGRAGTGRPGRRPGRCCPRRRW